MALAIINGEHDKDLPYIHQACGARLKRMFRKGQQVRLVGTGRRGARLQGRDDREGQHQERLGRSPTSAIYNVSPNLLELV